MLHVLLREYVTACPYAFSVILDAMVCDNMQLAFHKKYRSKKSKSVFYKKYGYNKDGALCL